MKRLLLATLIACALVPRPSEARGVLVLMNDSTYVANGLKNNYAPFFDLIQRSLKPGMRMVVQNYTGIGGGAAEIAAGTANYATYTLSELKDSISPTGTYPRFDFDLIVALGFVGNSASFTAQRYPIQLSLAANRPKVPVLYISQTSDLAAGGSDDSLGTNAGHVNPLGQGNTTFVTSPAGYAFPVDAYFSQRLPTTTSLAGNYVTPVLWLDMKAYTKADPNGQSGVESGSTAAADTFMAWFYNPPIASTRVGTANANGYGVINWELTSANGGGTNYPASQLSVVAVGMAARLAPAIFNFPAQKVALEIDDGCKRFANASSYPQVQDYMAGLDSLGVAKIPYTLGVEIDSLNALDDNGNTRFQNEFQNARKYGLGRFTVHCHRGFSNAQGGSSAGVADSTLASAASHQHVDIFGSKSQRYSLVGTSAATKDASVLSLLDDATTQLIDYCGDASLVSATIMPPTDDWVTKLAKSNYVNGNLSNLDSVCTSIALAGAGYKGFTGYRSVRVQFFSSIYNWQETYTLTVTGGTPRGVIWPLPNLALTASALGTAINSRALRPGGRPGLLLATSRYLWGTTSDTASVDAYGAMRFQMSNLLGEAVGFNRNINMTTANESGGSNQLGNTGYSKGVIWVTHVPNWRQGIGITTPVYGGGRPGWDNVRMVHGAMEAAKWAAQQANTSTVTYFKDGPMKWVYSDQITDRDLH